MTRKLVSKIVLVLVLSCLCFGQTVSYDYKVIPAANCNNATAGAGWSIPASNAPTLICAAATTTAHTNNLGGFLQWANNNTTTNAQFAFVLSPRWYSAVQPTITIFYDQGENTTNTVTVKWTFSTACYKNDGTLTDNPAFVAEAASAGKTMNATKNSAWAESVTFTAVTSGNNCAAGAPVIVKITSGNGTDTTAVNVSMVMIKTPTR